MPDWNREEAVGVVRNTSESDIPSEESGEKTKHTTCLNESRVWYATGWCDNVANAEHEEGEPEPEEEETEHDGRAQGEEPEHECEDEPSL